MSDKQWDNTNRGVLFKNDKEDNPARPDWSGNINVDGRELRLSAWVKTPRSGGAEFLSLSISEPNADYQRNTRPAQTKFTEDVVVEDIGDEPVDLNDIPF